MNVGKNVDVKAVSLVKPIPSLPCETDRSTSECRQKGESHRETEQEANTDPHSHSETLCREDIQEETENQYFDQTDDQDIDDLADPEVLGSMLGVGLMNKSLEDLPTE